MIERRRWKRAAIVGGILLVCPILGVAGMIIGMLVSFQRIETMDAPTPDDLSGGVRLGQYSMLLGALLGLIGAVLFTVALVRLHRLRTRPPEGAAARPWT